MKELLYEILEEAENSKIIIDDEEWPIGFNSQIIEDEKVKKRHQNEENNICLIIKREEEFLELLEEYVSLELSKKRKTPKFYDDVERNTKKWIISYLFANFTTEDFINPNECLRRKISYLKDETFNNLKLEIPIESMDSILKIENNIPSISMETPNRIDLSLEKVVDSKEYSYLLPSIYYGIRKENNDKVCYIYSVIKKNNKEDLEQEKTPYYKKINRKLFELNSDVKDLEDYQSLEETNIKDVSMSFIYALNVFLSLLQTKNIKKIKVIPYLPVRYHSRDITARRNNREDLIKRNNDIQDNLTNKLIRTFRRLCVQNKYLEITCFPMIVDEYLTLHLEAKREELDNMLLEEASKNIENKMNL